MRTLALTLFAGLVLSGCAFQPRPVVASNYATTLPGNSVQKIVGDASTKLRALYPPAQTRFEIQNPTDAFGVALVTALRSGGYAVLEGDPAAAALATQAASSAASSTPPGARGLSLSYIVDAPANASMYRVTFLIGSSTLSRAYLPSPDGVLQPAGAWVRQE